MLIDTHTHLYLDKFSEDRGEVIERAKNEGVQKFFLPNIDSESIDDMLKLEANYKDEFYAMMGLHPCSVKENFKSELAIVKEWLDKRSFCAIGEIGIDLYWDKTFLKEQVKAFEQQIDWAIELDVPIVIHSRESTKEVIEVLENCKHDKLRGIFHCFGGSIEEAEKIIEQGFYLGIGGVLTFKKAGLDKTMEHIALDHVVLETDAPFLAPSPFRGKRNESAYVKLVAEKLAAIKEIPFEEVAKITSSNALKIFQMEE